MRIKFIETKEDRNTIKEILYKNYLKYGSLWQYYILIFFIIFILIIFLLFKEYIFLILIIPLYFLIRSVFNYKKVKVYSKQKNPIKYELDIENGYIKLLNSKENTFNIKKLYDYDNLGILIVYKKSFAFLSKRYITPKFKEFLEHYKGNK